MSGHFEDFQGKMSGMSAGMSSTFEGMQGKMTGMSSGMSAGMSSTFESLQGKAGLRCESSCQNPAALLPTASVRPHRISCKDKKVLSSKCKV